HALAGLRSRRRGKRIQFHTHSRAGGLSATAEHVVLTRLWILTMTLTHRSLNLPRALRIAAGVCALVITSSCMDLTNVPNYDNESLDALVNDPTPARIATAAQGLQRSLRVNFAGGFSYLSLTAWRGREGFNLDPATPGLVPTNLTGPIGPEGY